VLNLPFAIPVPGRHQVGGAPDGADALLIAGLAAVAPWRRAARVRATICIWRG
jgi:hypothetical protein